MLTDDELAVGLQYYAIRSLTGGCVPLHYIVTYCHIGTYLRVKQMFLCLAVGLSNCI